MAYLDKQRSYGERTGGVSDPRLVRRVDRMDAVVTERDVEIVRNLIPLHSPDQRTSKMLEEMILGDIITKEAA